MSIVSLKAEIQQMRKSLLKAVNDFHAESTYDILIAIEKLDNKLTADLIKESKIGNAVFSAKKKFSPGDDVSVNDRKAADITAKANEMLLLWQKKIGEKGPSSDQQHPISSSKTESDLKHVVEAISKPQPSSTWSLSKLAGEQINPQRQKIISGFIDILTSISPKLDISTANEVAAAIERAVNADLPFDHDAKAYSAKCRSLAHNIKRNEALAKSIKSRSLPMDRLVHMTANELASHELLESRKDVLEQELDNKRGDWYEAHRAKILETNDIDPNNTWSYDADNGSDDEPEIAGD